MEPALQKQLSRQEIISKLNERHLNIPSIELQSYGELLRIYNSFVTPLEQREPNKFMSPGHTPDRSVTPANTDRPFMEDLIAHTVILNEHLVPNHEPHVLQQTKYLKLSFNALANSAKKRQCQNSMANGALDVTPAKRKPVMWP